MIEFKKHPIERIHPRPLKHASHSLQNLIHEKLWAKVILSIIFGIIIGLIINPGTGIVEKEIGLIIGEWLALPGNIFLALIQMIVIPLIFASIIRGIAASENIDQLKKSGLFVVAYFLVTTIVAITIGISIVSIIEPGSYINLTNISDVDIEPNIANELGSDESLPSMIVNIIPTNLFSAVLDTQFLQIIIFSIIFGIALVNMRPDQSKPILELLGSLQTVSITIIKWSMILVPLAVFGFIAKSVIQFGFDVLTGMLIYVVTVIIGLILVVLFYLVILFFAAGIKPLEFLKKIRDLQLLAFSTSSSAAVMPITMRTAEEKFGVKSSISQFIIPIGATINMDGTALYQTIAVIFLAQVFGVNLTFTALLLIIVTIVGSSIGAPGTPGVGIIILSAILTSIGVPLAGIALIIGFDRILDMLRTAVNVTGDITASVVLNKIIKSEQSEEALLKKEIKLEKQRKKNHHDVIIGAAA